jgi:uncharacterized protein YdbL (DUF1318 family)
MTQHKKSAFCILFMLLATTTAAFAADDMKSLQARFKDRLPAIHKLKVAGTVGETFKGYLDTPGKADADAQKVMEDENADRRKLYQLIADQEGVTPEKVAERNAIRNFKNAKSGEYLKGEDGKWKKKA